MNAPFFRLEADETLLFVRTDFLGMAARQSLARFLVRKFPLTGSYVASVGLELIAFIKPGSIELLAKPRRRIQRHECVNNWLPEACPCRHFIDPEVRGPWSLRKLHQHHPLCGIGIRSRENWHEVTERALRLGQGDRWKEDLKLATNPDG
jgi:hypothetical protein